MALGEKNIIDVCWTMYKSNTTFDFIQFVCEKDNNNLIYLKFLNLYLVKVFYVFLGKLIGYDVYRYVNIKLLKGYSKDKLNVFAKAFYNDFLEFNKIEYTFKVLSQLPKDEVKVLCSASLDVVVEQVAKEMKIDDFKASQLGYENNICTGKLEKDLLLIKHKLFVDENIDYVITDNKTDYQLIKLAKNYIVLSTENNRSFWESRNINISHIY